LFFRKPTIDDKKLLFGKNYKEILLVSKGKNDHNIYDVRLNYGSEDF